ncbi:hypothetical protein B0H13DRAFT_1871174 [Mycena leptocephala]|nr:hypothetical protein B0H13DRAFT_1871174 [Mycena leptocephala]
MGDMRRVEVLNLRLHGGTGNDADKFFDSSAGAAYTQPKLHSFTATGLPEEWVTRDLSLTPNIHTLSLVALSFSPFSAAKNIVSLPNLHNLELTHVHDFTPLLLNMRAPALRTLTIRDSAGQMNSIFSQWSQPSFVPAHLQSLELSDCLSPTDTPLLIGWLARLPALVRLTISDSDEIGDPDAPTASPETDLFHALASPHGAGPCRWLALPLPRSFVSGCGHLTAYRSSVAYCACARWGHNPSTRRTCEAALDAGPVVLQWNCRRACRTPQLL